MNAVIEHGTPLVDDPDRIGAVTQLGVDETSFLPANRPTPPSTPPAWSTYEAKVLIDMVEGNTAADLRRWTTNAIPDWLAGIEVVATDLAESFRAGLSPQPRPRHPGGRSVPRRARRQPLPGQGPPPGAERDARPSGPQGRPALSHPQAAPRRQRAPRRAGQRPHAAGPAHRRSPRRGARRLAGQGIGPRRVSHRRPQSGDVLLDKAIAGCTADDVRGDPLPRQHPRRRGGPRSSPTTTPAPATAPPRDSNLCVKRVKRCGHGFSRSSTTGYGCSSTPAASPGPNGPGRLASEPRPPHSTRSASNAC